MPHAAADRKSTQKIRKGRETISIANQQALADIAETPPTPEHTFFSHIHGAAAQTVQDGSQNKYQ